MNVWFYNDRYVFPPLMDPAASLFLDTIEIRMKQYEGQRIYYTTGDDYLDQEARSYTGDPVILTETTTLTSVAYNRHLKSSKLIFGEFTKASLSPPMEVDMFSLGLVCRYYEGRFRKLPDFDTLTPLKSSVVADVDAYTIRDTVDAYALEFEGLFYARNDGIYMFYIVSDDGGRIYIGDQEIVVNDGLHEMCEASGQAALKKGLHSIKVQFFDYGGAEGLELYVSGPGIEKQRIPTEWYNH